jgi:uncharacterized protein (DUF1015 family)
MADIEPLLALRYDLDKVGGLQDVVAPPYDVIGPEQRAELAAGSPYNVVRIDLPEGNGDPYGHAAEILAQWREEGVVTQDSEPAIWALAQDYTGSSPACGSRSTARGGFALTSAPTLAQERTDCA